MSRARASRGWLAALVVLLVSALAAVLAFNAWLPAGYHLAIASDGVVETQVGAGRVDFVSALTTRGLSRRVLAWRADRCDLPVFKDEQRTSGHGNALGRVVYFLGQPGTDQAYLDGLLTELAAHCDPNVLGEDESMRPLPMAVVFREPQAVTTLLAHGARKDMPVESQNERIRGKTVLELADLMLARPRAEADKARLQAIRDQLAKP